MDTLVPERIKNDANFALTVVEEANNWQVLDQDDYANAVELRKEYKKRLKVVEAELEPAREKTYAAYKDALDRLNKYTKPFIEADATIKKKCEKWLNAENEKRLIAEAKAMGEVLIPAGDTHKEVPAVIMPPVTAVIPKVSNPVKWKARIEDYSLFLVYISKGVDNNQAQREMVEKAFLPWLQKHAEANQSAIPIPGVVFKQEIGMTVRA